VVLNERCAWQRVGYSSGRAESHDLRTEYEEQFYNRRREMLVLRCGGCVARDIERWRNLAAWFQRSTQLAKLPSHSNFLHEA